MSGYVINFTVYTMAMLGLICFAVFVYKKVTDGTIRKDNTKFLSIEDSMSLNPRKTLHVVRAGKERFLIASDIDRTTLIAKLTTDEKVLSPEKTFERFLNTEKEIDIPLDTLYNNDENSIRLEPLSTAKKTISRQPKVIDKRELQEMVQKINKL